MKIWKKQFAREKNVFVWVIPYFDSASQIESEFVNVEGVQKSIPRNRFLQATQDGGMVFLESIHVPEF